MTARQSSAERVLELGQKLLTSTKSIVRFLGPFRNRHAQWDAVAREARNRLDPRDADSAARMDRALARFERANILGLIESERDRLRSGRITVRAEHETPLLDELLRLELVEWTALEDAEKGRFGVDDTHKLTVKGSPERLVEAADELLARARLRFRRAKAVTVRREAAAMPAINAAEGAAAMDWLRRQAQRLRAVLAEFEAKVAEHAVALAGLVSLDGQRLGRLRSSSVSGLLAAAARSLLEGLQPDKAVARTNGLEDVDWEDLGVKFECELAEFARRQWAHGEKSP